MKPTLTRRQRRTSSSSKEGGMFKKENQPEQAFFGKSSHETFFQPASQAIQRKCDNCEEDDKKVARMPEGKKEEEEKLQRTEDKKEEEKIMKMDDKKEEDKLQKKEANTSAAGKSAGNYISSLNGKGNSLPVQVNYFFSSKMGYDFSNVKIHNDKAAAESAKEVNAKAYTVRNHIVFNEGKYQPEKAEGKYLLAHELAHVVQQRKDTNEKSLQRNVLDGILPPGIDAAKLLSSAATAITTAVVAVPAVIAAGSTAIITIGGLALAGDTWFKFQQLKTIIEARSGEKINIVALATSVLANREICPPFSVVGGLMPAFGVSGESSAFGKLVEMIIIRDYCQNNRCTTESHYFDDNLPNNFINYLYYNNPKIRYGLNNVKSALKRPDIMAHLASLKEFYEIKPNSGDGRSAGIEKLAILDAYWSALNLPYKRGTNYLQSKKEIPILGSLAKLRFFRKGPGLILYDICFRL